MWFMCSLTDIVPPSVMKSIISDLHLKFAEKTWNDTFHLVRRCMVRRLPLYLSVSSIKTMKSRLEMIAKQQGMGFHVTDATCYLTADLFYLEVVLLPGGGVEEVKVAPHGGSPVPSEGLLQLLRLKHFADFSAKLAGLFSQYNIPGDNSNDIVKINWNRQNISAFRLPNDCDAQMDVINYGRIGCVIAGKEGTTAKISVIHKVDAVVQTAQVTVGVSNTTHRLQMAPLIPQPPQVDPQGCPVFLPLNEVPNETLPACFLLLLQPAIPVTVPRVNRLSQITGLVIPDVDLQWAPLPKLLMRGSLGANSSGETLDEQDTIFTVSRPGVTHSYILPGDAWEAPDQIGAVMDRIPFTHPAQVPEILKLLRRQCATNTLLSSCITSQHVSSVGDLHFEILPQTETSFSVTFQQPNTDALAVLLVTICDSLQIKCSLFGAGQNDRSVDEYISTVMKRSMSIPVTLMTLYTKLTDLSAPPSAAVTDILSEINTSPAVNPYPFPGVGVLPHWMNSNGHISEMI
uniref:Mediator of RNA polymerase II transcription subunit 1 n=1 Tax=Anabas testudineus TaxID=64144 RepID=A0A3Q1JGB5_ANATE